MINEVVATIAEAHVTQEAEEEASHHEHDHVPGNDQPPVQNIEIATDALVVLAHGVDDDQYQAIAIHKNVD